MHPVAAVFSKLWGWFRGESKADDFMEARAFRVDRLPNTRFPYHRHVREGLDSNVVMAPLAWILRNFTEAELTVERKAGRLWTPLDDHRVLELVDRPNAYYNGDVLWKATLISYVLDGNAYWLKVRNALGEILGFLYLPHFLVEPRSPDDGSLLVSHYDYYPWHGAPAVQLPVEDVVHYRFGLDPRDMRRGLSPVRPLLREVYTDDEAANFSATMLRNFGVPGGIIAPKSGDAMPNSDDIEEMRQYMKTAFSGDRRGEWLVLGTPTETSQFGFDPQALMIGGLRDIAEERVCAALGLPAAVVGFGAGLQQTKVGATMKELRRLAWTSCLQPMQRSLSRQLGDEVIPTFERNPRRVRLSFDISSVPAFQEEELETARKVSLLVEKGILRVDRAQEMLGLEVDESQAIYLRSSSSAPVPAEEDPMATRQLPPGLQEEDDGEDGGDEDEEGDDAQEEIRAALEVLHKRGA